MLSSEDGRLTSSGTTKSPLDEDEERDGQRWRRRHHDEIRHQRAGEVEGSSTRRHLLDDDDDDRKVKASKSKAQQEQEAGEARRKDRRRNRKHHMLRSDEVDMERADGGRDSDIVTFDELEKRKPLDKGKGLVMMSVVTGREAEVDGHTAGNRHNASTGGGRKGKRKRGMFFRGAATIRENCEILARRLYFSSVTGVVYIFVLVVNLFVILRGFFWDEIDVWLVAAECFVTFMLVLEVMLRMFLQGRRFFEDWRNIVDTFIMVLCVVLLALSPDLWSDVDSYEHQALAQEAGRDLAEQLLTGGRFAFQLARTCTLASTQSRRQTFQDPVDFSSVV